MLQQTGRNSTHEYGVSEVIGAVMLIAVVAAAIGIIAIAVLSQPPPEKIPALEAVISNTGNTVQILHNGGDTLKYGDFKVLIDGIDRTPSGTTWSQGETLTITDAPGAKTVQILYIKGSGTASAVMSSANFGSLSNSTMSVNIMAGAGVGGTISPSGAVAVEYGGSQTFSIEPDYGYRITDVKVDGVSVGTVSSYTFSAVTSSHAIYAAFAKNPVITVTAGNHGSIDPSGTVIVNYTGSRRFEILPEPGYRIQDVLVDTVSQGAITNYTFSNVLTDHTISASFVPNPVITASAGSGGSISPSGAVTVIYGSSQAFTIAPTTGYHITDVLVDGVSNGTITGYTFTNVVADHTISATFGINRYNINATAGPNGGISPGNVTLDYGGSQSYTITPNTGYHVADVLVDGVSQGVITDYSFTNVAADHTISATFAITTFTITATSDLNGTISPPGVTTVSYGGSQSYTITPNAHYHVTDVLVNGVSQGAITAYSFTNVTANHTISATSAIDTYSITANSGLNGAVTPSGVTAVNYGGSQTYTITPNTGYHIANVVVDGVSNGTISGYTFTNVAADHTISATFAINRYNINATAGPNGAISPGNVTLDYGASQAYTITPNTGYHIANVVVDGVSNGTISGYTFTNVVANHTISATFAINRYTINATAGPNGVISPGNVTLDYGASQAYTITPSTGYHIANVLVDGVSNGTISGYTFTSVAANHTISATFGINRYNINATAGPNGAISPGNVTLDYGGSQTYTITPNIGYHITNVLVDGVSNGTITGYTFTNVIANHTLSATFGMTAPVANFTGTPVRGGVPLNVIFTDTSTNNPTSWVWNFGDTMNTTVSYAQHPNHTYEYPGNYSVQLYATNAGGTNTTIRQGYIFTYYPAVANFTGTPTSGSYGLSGLTVHFTDSSTGGVSYYNWTFGDGKAKTEYNYHQNPGHTYDAVGLYSVNLSVYNSFSSDYLLRPNYINVTPNPPEAGMIPDPVDDPAISGMAPLTVEFKDFSYTTVPVSYSWYFGDGSANETTMDANHTYTNPGTYSVIHAVSNIWGYSAITNTVTVYGAPAVTSVSPSTGSTAGSTSVTILGTNLIGATGVTFGGAAATGVSVINATAVSAITPVHAAGAVTVVVTTPNGTATGTNAYTYLIPITASSGANGAVTPAGTTLYTSGSTPTYTITPNTGYHVVDVLVDGSSVGAVTSYTFPSLTTSHTISATFAINTYTITASSGANGAITPTGVTTVNYGDSQAYTITPVIKYHIDTLTVDGVTTTYPPKINSPYTFSNVQDNHTISVTFAPNAREEIFFDTFDPVTMTASGWTVSSPNVPAWFTGTPKNGTHSVQFTGASSTNPDRWIRRSVPTTGYSDIQVSYQLGAYSMEANEYVAIQYSTNAGGAYTNIQRIPATNVAYTGSYTIAPYTSATLPSAANYQDTNFWIRVGIWGSNSADIAWVDDVKVTGIPDYI